MFDKFTFSKYFSEYQFHALNAGIAVVVAIASYALLKGLLRYMRSKFCTISDARADRAWLEILKKTLASTSNMAIAITALLIGLAMLTLPAPWGERVKHLWFLALGFQLAIYLHRATAIAATHYFRKHARRHDVPATVAHTLRH